MSVKLRYKSGLRAEDDYLDIREWEIRCGQTEMEVSKSKDIVRELYFTHFPQNTELNFEIDEYD